MHVVHLSKYYYPFSGGVESVVRDLATFENVDATVIATDRDNLAKCESIDGVSVIRSKEWLNFCSTSIAPGYFIDVCKHLRCDILHVHLPNPLANLALILTYPIIHGSTKIVVHWHSDIIKQKKLLKLYQPLVNMLLKRADSIIVTSQRYLDSSEQLRKFKGKCQVLPIGIDSLSGKVNNDLVTSIKNTYKNRKIVFSLGRHIYYKGFEFLIEAATRVEDAVFLIGGSGPDTKKYLGMIQKAGLQDRVKLIGRISDADLPNYYAASDIFCFPSIEKSEAFGVVQLEAMSLGVPIVCTDLEGSGVPWVNQHMVSGLVCAPKCINSLSNAINTILLDDNLHLKFSSGALERYNDLFGKEKMNRELFNLYNSIVNK